MINRSESELIARERRNLTSKSQHRKGGVSARPVSTCPVSAKGESSNSPKSAERKLVMELNRNPTTH